MTAIAIFTGTDGRKLPSMYVRKFVGSEVTYKYNTLCILDYEDRRLAASKNPFALVMLAAKKGLLKGENLDKILLQEKIAIAKLLIQRGYSEKKTNGILSFLHNCVRFEKPKTNRSFESEIDRITGKTNTMGIIEQVKQMKLEEAEAKGVRKGRKKGRTENAIAVVKNLMAETKFSDEKIAGLVGVTEAFVRRIRRAGK